MARSVLIVDSDQAFAQSAQDALEILGVAVHVLDDASIDVVRKIRPTVLLLNVELTRKPMGGFSLCSRIRRDKDLKELPIFLTSSEATPQSLEKHAQSADRADEYASKPIAMESLIGRLTQLMENAPDLPESPPERFDSDFGEPREVRGDVPPPIPPPIFSRNSGMMSPPPLPPMPPPLPKTGDVGVKTSSAEFPAANTPPPLVRESPPADTELWPGTRYEDAFRQATATEPEQALGRASPEERLNALRTLVKKYQTREKALKSTWDEVMLKGAELSRQIAAAQANAQQSELRLEDVIKSRDTTTARLKAVEGEFRAFQDEITRIFQEKDAEESEKTAQAIELRAEIATLKQQLKDAHESLADDQKRLGILQEEIGELEQLRISHETATGALADVRARLEMVESVSTDRAAEVESLQDQLDQLLFEKNNNEQRLEREYNAKLEVAIEEHQGELDRVHGEQKERLFSVEATHLAQVESLEERHRDLLEALNNTHEAEATEYEAKRKAASEQIGALNTRVIELEAALDSALAKDDRIAELETSIRELEETLDAERSEAGRRIGELEEELDGVQTSMFERMQELEQYKKNASTSEARAADLESALRLSEKSLKQSKTEAAAHKKGFEEAESERQLLSDRTEGLEEQLRATTASLEHERARWQKAEELVRKAKEKFDSQAQEKLRFEKKIAELESAVQELTGRAQNEAELEARLDDELATRQELEAMLASERSARGEVETQLEEAQDHLSRREAELSDSYAEATSLKRKLDASGSELQAKIATLTKDLDRSQQQTSGREAELAGLKRSIEDAGVQIGSLTAEVDAIQAELFDAQDRLTAYERETAQLAAREQQLTEELGTKSERLRQLEITSAEMKKELDRFKVDNRALVERQHLVKRVAGVLDRARRSIPDHFAEASAEAAVEEALKPQIYTGEIEPLELSDTVDPDYSPGTAVFREADLVSKLGARQDPVADNAAPFAALMAEIQATEADLASEFDEQFAAEPTTENPAVEAEKAKKQRTPPKMRGRAGGTLTAPPRRGYEEKEEEEEEGSVTEIIRLDKLD